jgi:hypothetical protein
MARNLLSVIWAGNRSRRNGCHENRVRGEAFEPIDVHCSNFVSRAVPTDQLR